MGRVIRAMGWMPEEELSGIVNRIKLTGEGNSMTRAARWISYATMTVLAFFALAVSLQAQEPG